MNQKHSLADRLINLFLFLNVLLGLVVAPDYGVSWDEAIHKEYAITTAAIYKSPQIAFEDNPSVFGPYNLRYYGPFYTTISNSLSDFVSKKFPQWHPAASLHYVYFLTFLLGVYWLYILSKRIMSEWAALGAAILFATQPLLFGHAFINPKDTPFMVFFIGGIYFGIKMVDGFNNGNDLDERNNIKITDGFIWLIKKVQIGQFGAYGSDKARNKKTVLEIKPLIIDIIKSFNKTLPSAVWKNLKDKNVIIAGVLLGLLTSIRVLGPFVGLLVIYYFFIRNKEKSIPTSIAYITIAMITCYLTWPYLWSAPFLKMLESFLVMSNFSWENFVLFNGTLYPAFNLPRSYIPWLVTLQFSEPLIILAGSGIIISLMILFSNRHQAYKLQIYFLWIGLPLFGLLAIRPVIYDNFRQFLFIMPPLFIFAGIALDTFYQIIKQKWSTVLLFLALIVPAIFSLVRLHPYQYVYYNSFAGGTSGAFRYYETDYWMTALKEAAEFLNQQDHNNAKIASYGPDWIVDSYLEEGFEVASFFDLEEYVIQEEYDYQIIPTRSNYDLSYQYFGEVVFSVEIDGATLVDVVEIKR